MFSFLKNQKKVNPSWTEEELTQRKPPLFQVYVNHIRNLKTLSPEMLENVKQFNEAEKMKLLMELNKALKVITEVVIEEF
jgi:hypothetical protein